MPILHCLKNLFSAMNLPMINRFSPGKNMIDSSGLIDERIMEETYNYPQAVIDSLYEEGELDYIFLCDLLVDFGKESHVKRTQEEINFSVGLTLEKTLLLTNFLIGSHDFAGFHMKEYGKIDKTFNDPAAFENFIKKSFAHDVDYFDRISTEDRYTVGLIKIHKQKKAPPIPPEIENIIE